MWRFFKFKSLFLAVLFVCSAFAMCEEEMPLTIYGISGIPQAGSSNYADVNENCMNFTEAWKTVTYEMPSIATGKYKLELRVKAHKNNTSGTPILNIQLNGALVLRSKITAGADYFDGNAGIIEFTGEKNAIKIILANNGFFCLESFKLTRITEFDSGDLLINHINQQTSSLNTDNYTGSYSDMELTAVNAFVRSKCVTVTHDVKLDKSGTYSMIIRAGSTQSHSYHINYSGSGISGSLTSEGFASTGDTLIYTDEEVGSLYLPKGLYTFTITYSMQNMSGGMGVSYFLLNHIETPPSFSVTNFEFLDECGYPAPFVLDSGITLYASAKIKKMEACPDAGLIVAQYSSQNEIVSIDIKTIKTNELLTGVENEILFPVTLLDGCKTGYVKAFLWNYPSIAPVSECILLKEYKIFNSNILDKEINYAPAADYGYFVPDNYGVRAIFYDGSDGSKIFAYLGVPETVQEGGNPAVVLVHGINGRANADWVKKWTDKGYIAIAPDLYGNGPDFNKHQFSGNIPYDSDSFVSLENGAEVSGMYHAVVNIIYAGNILRELSMTDAAKTGITGVSWGAVASAIAVGIDDRFAFSASVFGGGYLYKSQSYFKNMFNGENIMWDPSNFIKKSKTPMLWVNSNSDGSFSIDAFSKSYELSENGYLSIQPNLWHLNKSAENIKEIYTFADSITKNIDGLIKLIDVEYSGNTAYVKADISGRKPVNAVLFYNTDNELEYGGGSSNIIWNALREYETEQEGIYYFQIPDKAVRFYISITDPEGNIISTKLIDRKHLNTP